MWDIQRTKKKFSVIILNEFTNAKQNHPIVKKKP